MISSFYENRDIFAKCYEAEGFFSTLLSIQYSDILNPVLESPADAHMQFNGQDMIIMRSVNNYLGL